MVIWSHIPLFVSSVFPPRRVRSSNDSSEGVRIIETTLLYCRRWVKPAGKLQTININNKNMLDTKPPHDLVIGLDRSDLKADLHFYQHRHRPDQLRKPRQFSRKPATVVIEPPPEISKSQRRHLPGTTRWPPHPILGNLRLDHPLPHQSHLPAKIS